jgi:hypothetical protein
MFHSIVFWCSDRKKNPDHFDTVILCDDEFDNSRLLVNIDLVDAKSFYDDPIFINTHLKVLKENIIPIYLNKGILGKNIVSIIKFYEKFVDDYSNILIKFCDEKSKIKAENYFLLR